MNKSIAFSTVALLITAPAFAQKIVIDYASGFDFDAVDTFQYVETAETDIQDNSLMADRVATMIREELVKGGLREVEETPDIYVTYHYVSEQQRRLSTTSMGYGGYWDSWGPYDPFGGPTMGSSVTREYTYEKGTLIVDAYDSVEKKLVWRGSGTVTVKEQPSQQIKQVERILTKMGKRWDRILAKSKP
jgi:hypothetical protein